MVAPGEESLNTMIKGVKRGILLTRFSGGRPNRNGDFSGVAKNSFYLEDGEIKHPLTETMIAGNLAALFRNITAVSQERVNFWPWDLPLDCFYWGDDFRPIKGERSE